MPPVFRKPWISPEEYLAAERVAEVPHEYVDGEVFAMVGASRRHNQIAGTIYTAMRQVARRRGCEAFIGDVKVRVEAANAYYYPDVVATCARGDDDPYVVHAPTVIVEVLSDSTEAIDRREKRANYQTIPSLREFVLVSQNEPLVEIYRRRPGGWMAEVATEGEVVLESLDATLSLDDLYAS
ncbi:Uma2 family endonuclease [Azospirillum sp. sgz302134]